MNSKISSIENKLRDLSPERDSKIKEIEKEQKQAETMVINLAEKRREREAQILADRHNLERELDEAKRIESEERAKKAA